MAKLLVVLIASLPALTILVLKFKLQRQSGIEVPTGESALKHQPAQIMPSYRTFVPPRSEWPPTKPSCGKVEFKARS